MYLIAKIIFMDKPNNYDNFDENYKESIKYSVEKGKYFKEAFDWYSNTYLRPIVDRTFFVFMSIMGIVIIYYVISLVFMILPLKEDIYITIKEKDLTKYETSIIDLSKNSISSSSDEQILQYLITNYVIERETHNYKSANIFNVNEKLAKIKNTSSKDVYNNFKYFMSSEYKDGPYYYFGKDIETEVQINSFKFVRIKRDNLISKLIDYFNVNLMPIKAEVEYTLTTKIGDNITKQKRKAVLSFKFVGIDYNEASKKYSNVSFIVTSYKNKVLN